MKRSSKIVLHLILWFLVIAFWGLMIGINIKMKSVIEEMISGYKLDVKILIWSSTLAIVAFMSTFYTSYFYIHKLIKKISWINFIIIIFVFALLVGMKVGIHKIPFQQPKTPFSNGHSMSEWINLTVIGLLTIIQAAMALGMRAIISYFDEKKRRKELETSNLKNELGMLRSQVNPHFLFNTLNNIDSLIKKKPEQASDLLIKLSDEMRYMLYDANIDEIEIELEKNFLQNYITLQEIRINHSNPIKYSIDIDNPNTKIPPMLFLPLVENAFKHGKFIEKEDFIQLNLKLSNNILNFYISNAYDSESTISTKHGGLGLDIVKRRFNLLFPENHSFEVQKENQLFAVTFTINLNEN